MGVWWVVFNVLPYAIVGTVRNSRTLQWHDRTPAQDGMRAENLDIEVEPGLTLRGWLIHAVGPTHGTVVLLHGINSCKASMLSLAKLLVTHGYNCLAYDSRGHGESGGNYCTYGYYEHRDCSCYVAEAMRRHSDLGPVSLYGNSFGGAVALQTLADDPRFACGIVECTFATLREIVHDYERELIHFPLGLLTDLALNRAGEIAHFPVDQVRPEESARRITCPVLILHGTDDHNISVHYGERIFRHLTAPGCEWFPVRGADHGTMWRVDGPGCERQVLDFLAAHGRQS